VVRIELYQDDEALPRLVYSADLTNKPADEALLLTAEMLSKPDDLEVMHNYPNPFNAETVIKYNVHETGHVELVVYNELGQRILTLVDEVKPSGHYQAIWNAKTEQSENVSSGIYFYLLKTGRKQRIKKMILLR